MSWVQGAWAGPVLLWGTVTWMLWGVLHHRDMDPRTERRFFLRVWALTLLGLFLMCFADVVLLRLSIMMGCVLLWLAGCLWVLWRARRLWHELIQEEDD